MALPSFLIKTCTEQTYRGYLKPPTEVDEQWDAVKDFSCDIQNEEPQYIQRVTSLSVNPALKDDPDVKRVFKKSIVFPKNDNDPVCTLRWENLKNGKGIYKIFLQHLVGQVGAVALKSQILAACRIALNKTAKHLGINHRAILPEFTNEEVASQGHTARSFAKLRSEYPSCLYPSALPCFQFAFLQARDPGALKTLFKSFDLIGTVGYGVLPVAIPLFEHLTMNYEVVPAFEPGDLVLYLKDGVPKHMAYCRERGLLESKYGYSFDVYIHDLYSAGAEHSNQVIFFRKKRPEKAPA